MKTDESTVGTPEPSTRMVPAAARGRLVADVARAGSISAPYWPLSAFVAVNPLGGLTDLAFDEATAAARCWFGARTHLPIAAFRAEHARGTITDADVDRAISRRMPDIAGRPTLIVQGVTIGPTELLRWDLLHGPVPEAPTPADEGQVAAALDDLTATWCATFVDETHVPWGMPNRDDGFYRAWRAVAGADRRLAGIIGREARQRIAALPDDPVELLDLALGARGVEDHGRVAAIRTLLLRTPGWASFARWSDDWAPADHPGRLLRTIDLAAVRAAMDHLAPQHLDLAAPSDRVVSAGDRSSRIDAIVSTFGGEHADADFRVAVEELVASVPEIERQTILLSAHEWNFRDRLLARLAPAAPAAPETVPDEATRPEAQLVFCIDVRSEGFRRRLEALGDYETFGFAGFFGVPVRWRPLGSEVAQARCPVLVSPQHEVVEVAVDDDARYLAECSATSGLHDAFYAAKGGIASPFALAESAGWFAGPTAALRTLVPPHAAVDPAAPDGGRKRSWWRRTATPPRTSPVVDEALGAGLRSGLSLDERTLFAEAIVTTIGMADFAPVVVLCGHGSVTVNNPHASSLDCGACGGAPGGASARIACAILNDADVRAGLVERGIEIPADTWFVAAEHDTTADTVTILDGDTFPAHVVPLVSALQRDLGTAGEINARDRANRLPGHAGRVRDRGHDWAQVRPEWGLAANAAFIVGPRSITADHDLRGRSFLHSYVAERDPEGVALETIMTAPLVVAQWISSQYYFSTVEPDVFGAGDKMLHNPVGGVGVLIGQSGDLAVGLPMQSVMLGEQRAHDPLRLLAVIQAPLDRVADIIERNNGLRQLVHGEWIHVVARATEHDPWSLYGPGGDWVPWTPAAPTDDIRTRDLSTPLSI